MGSVVLDWINVWTNSRVAYENRVHQQQHIVDSEVAHLQNRFSVDKATKISNSIFGLSVPMVLIIGSKYEKNAREEWN